MFTNMQRLALGLISALLAPAAHAAKHQLIIGTFSTSFLYTVEFDDQTNALTLLQNTTAASASQWLSLSHDKKNLYGNTNDGDMAVVSYSLVSTDNSTTPQIVYDSTVALGTCDTTAVHLEALPQAPYTIYGVSYRDTCGGVASVDESGAALASTQNFTFDNPSSSLHGLGFHPSGAYLYTADMGAQAVWTHAIDATTGDVTFVANTSYAGGEPRHVNTHPSGAYAYAITEDTSEVLLLTIDESTGAAAFIDGEVYGIVPANATGTHRGETARLSASGAVLYATTRTNASDAESVEGFVSGFSLDGAGKILSQDFIVATTTGGGSSTGASNMVVPSLDDDDLFAILDHSTGFVEIWRRNEDRKGAAVIAHLDINDNGGCCSNGVWLS